MRCPRCGIELNPHSERCPRCGMSSKMAKPDGDTMTRVRRQIAVVRREASESDEDYSDTSFSPVIKFEKESADNPTDVIIDDNPAYNFDNSAFIPVDIGAFLNKQEEDEADVKHRSISAEIRSMVKNKEDDLLAEYYFKDGISDLERYQLAKSFEESEKAENVTKSDDGGEQESSGNVPEEEMSEAARRLNTFPEDSGIDKALTFIGEKYDSSVLAVKQFFNKLVWVRIKLVYNKIDDKTAPFLDKLLDKFYYTKSKNLQHSRSDGAAEKKKIRRRIWSVCGVFALILVCVGIFTASLFTHGITGQWIVSYDVSGKPNVMMEFTPTGSAMVSVKSEDGWHVHKQGKYKTQRRNGHDMLTISYEDGTVSRLYYVIEGKSGKFINVETNIESVYDLK